MTSLERWLAVFRRERPDRVPMDYWGTPEFGRALQARLGAASLDEALGRLGVDFVVTVRPSYAGPPLRPGEDVFGCRFRTVSFGGGAYDECVAHPLAGFDSVEEIERGYRWPSPDWWDYRGLARRIEGLEDHPVRGGDCEPFLIYKNLRGQERALLDLVERPEIVRFCLDRLFGLALEDARRIYETLPGRVHLSYVAEDMGGQSDLLFSPALIREFLLPGMRRAIGLAHEAGARVFHHNDGSIRRILPDLVEAGIDLLNPIQWRCPGMEREGLKRDFGDRIVFHGGMDNQSTLPFGTPDDVRREVRDNLRLLGAGGGYILAPCHNIQPGTPVGNVIAMYETCAVEGRY